MHLVFFDTIKEGGEVLIPPRRFFLNNSRTIYFYFIFFICIYSFSDLFLGCPLDKKGNFGLMIKRKILSLNVYQQNILINKGYPKFHHNIGSQSPAEKIKWDLNQEPQNQ